MTFKLAIIMKVNFKLRTKFQIKMCPESQNSVLHVDLCEGSGEVGRESLYWCNSSHTDLENCGFSDLCFKNPKGQISSHCFINTHWF